MMNQVSLNIAVDRLIENIRATVLGKRKITGDDDEDRNFRAISLISSVRTNGLTPGL